MTQLAIDLSQPPSYSPADFILGESNRMAYALVMNWPDWPERIVAISGPPACGKSHLAHIWAARASAAIKSPSELGGAPADLFGDAPALALDGEWPDQWDETSLFHLLNFTRNDSRTLLLTHTDPPDRWRTALPDLNSRLRALPQASISQPDDALLKGLMLKLLADRQLHANPDIIDYTIKHIERSSQVVREIVERIDSASLQQGRTITLPFVSKLLSENYDSITTK